MINRNIDGETIAFLLALQSFVLEAMKNKVINTAFGIQMLEFINTATNKLVGESMVNTLGTVVTHPSEAMDLQIKLKEGESDDAQSA